MSIKDKYIVKSIDSYLCKDWLLNKHYAKRLCSISYSFGLFNNDILIGILTIGKPASNQLCIGVCGIENSKYVYELNRLCINENIEKNVLSYFLSKSLKMIKDNMILISYADTKMNHTGYIYQATNWIYTGKTKERTDIGFEDNKHSRHYNKDIDYTNRKFRSSKHRYIYFIGKLKNKFKKELKYKIESYPKGNNKRYDASYKPTIQIELF
ncbi:hypothetical protein UFOVP387_42 [uncultured Caudovirales phage]|uniref:Protein Mom n=1 Tax=uncultured Caudovirales phage TaxID=2100421 RepID=A0A6J7X262_9CAUD|nr:hypothetical protein UFOVP387_42 [uncultured Caudovirales phage]